MIRQLGFVEFPTGWEIQERIKKDWDALVLCEVEESTRML
jgi:hypothetical protein